MFRLLRYFSFISIIAIVVIAGLLTWQARLRANSVILSVGENINKELATLVTNHHGKNLRDFLEKVYRSPAAGLSEDPEARQLKELLAKTLVGTKISALTVFAPNGRPVITSTNTGDQVKVYEEGLPFLDLALAGRSSSQIIQAIDAATGKPAYPERHLISTVSPIYAADNQRILGAFLLSQDITDYYESASATRLAFSIILVALLLLAFGLLFGVVRQADTVIARQAREAEESEQALKVSHQILEDQVEKLRESDVQWERFRGINELSGDWYWDQDTEFRYTSQNLETVEAKTVLRVICILAKRAGNCPMLNPSVIPGINTRLILRRVENFAIY